MNDFADAKAQRWGEWWTDGKREQRKSKKSLINCGQ